jgi:hypothetical protein
MSIFGDNIADWLAELKKTLDPGKRAKLETKIKAAQAASRKSQAADRARIIANRGKAGRTKGGKSKGGGGVGSPGAW